MGPNDGCSRDKYQSSLIFCTRADALLAKYRGIYIILDWQQQITAFFLSGITGLNVVILA